MTPHDTGSTGTPGTPRATASPARTVGPQGPTLGELSDAYLQDYQVRQFRSQSTARGRNAAARTPSQLVTSRTASSVAASPCSLDAATIVR